MRNPTAGMCQYLLCMLTAWTEKELFVRREKSFLTEKQIHFEMIQTRAGISLQLCDFPTMKKNLLKLS